MFNGKYILCIDDDEDDYQLLAESFNNINAQVSLRFEKSGDEALDFLSMAVQKNELPGLIVLDLNMPGLDGMQTLVRVKTIPSLSKTPTLILSTSITGVDIPEIEKNGASIFQKPNTVKEYDEIARTIVVMMA